MLSDSTGIPSSYSSGSSYIVPTTPITSTRSATLKRLQRSTQIAQDTLSRSQDNASGKRFRNDKTYTAEIDLYCREVLPNLSDSNGDVPAGSPKSRRKSELAASVENEIELEPINGAAPGSVGENIKVKLLSRFMDVKLKEKLNVPGGAAARFMKLREYCTPMRNAETKEVEFWRLWLEIPKGTISPRQEALFLNMLVYEADFDSQLPECPRPTQKCHYIKVCEDEDNPDQFLFQIRMDPSGRMGEVIHIQKGQKLDGKEVRAICMQLLEFLRIDEVDLVDSAYVSPGVPVTSKRSDEKDLLIRKYKGIVSEEKVISDKEACWYGEVGFTLLRDGIQNPERFYAAINKIRNLKLYDLYTEVWNKRSDRRKLLAELFCVYLRPDLNPVPFNADAFGQTNMHELAKTVYNISRKKMGTPAQQARAPQDFRKLVRAFLTWQYSPPKPSKAWLEVNEALSIIETHAIWVKYFK